jgi:hypothetical protein
MQTNENETKQTGPGLLSSPLQPGKAAYGTEQRINASALQALLCAHHLKAPGPWIALPEHIDAGACGTGYRHSWRERERLGCTPHAMRGGVTPMSRAGLLRVVENVRTCHGAAGVKKTWDTNYRALVKSLAPWRKA